MMYQKEPDGLDAEPAIRKEEAMMKQRAKRILILFAAVVVLWVAVFLGARCGWRLAGFSACRTVRIGSVSVEMDCVKIEVPVEQPINAVCMKAGDDEYQIWPE